EHKADTWRHGGSCPEVPRDTRAPSHAGRSIGRALGLPGVSQVGDEGAVVRGQDEPGRGGDLVGGDPPAPAGGAGFDEVAYVARLERADVLIAQAVALQNVDQLGRTTQARRGVPSARHDPGLRDALERAEIDEPGEGGPVDGVVAECSAGPENARRLRDD